MGALPRMVFAFWLFMIFGFCVYGFFVTCKISGDTFCPAMYLAMTVFAGCAFFRFSSRFASVPDDGSSIKLSSSKDHERSDVLSNYRPRTAETSERTRSRRSLRATDRAVRPIPSRGASTARPARLTCQRASQRPGKHDRQHRQGRQSDRAQRGSRIACRPAR